MRTTVLLLIGLILLISCDKEETLTNSQLCGDEYFYYSEGSKIYLKHSLYELWIEFKQSDVSGEKAKSILNKYPFLNTDNYSADSYYNGFKAIIKERSNCIDIQNYLKELNKNNEVFSATPVFYFSDNDPESFWILLSEVLTKNDETVISESDFINYAKTYNLELIESKYSTQQFKVKEVKTGFEALEIANRIYESGKVQYSHPNFIVKIELY